MLKRKIFYEWLNNRIPTIWLLQMRPHKSKHCQPEEGHNSKIKLATKIIKSIAFCTSVWLIYRLLVGPKTEGIINFPWISCLASIDLLKNWEGEVGAFLKRWGLSPPPAQWTKSIYSILSSTQYHRILNFWKLYSHH